MQLFFTVCMSQKPIPNLNKGIATCSCFVPMLACEPGNDFKGLFI